jgi:hypothetical protein
MKLIKVRIRSGSIAMGEPQMVYPVRYDAQEVDRQGVYATGLNPASCSMSGGIGRGESQEFCIIALEDSLADEYALDPDMEIVTETVADTLMEQWRIGNDVPEETVTDPDRINAIQTKIAAGLQPSTNDLKALDVNDDTVRGINKTRMPINNRLKNRLTTVTR